MVSDLKSPDPSHFDLTRFSELLPAREYIVGENPVSFEGFGAGMNQSLAPATPYECVIAENLISIEWELVQHRHMRDANLRKITRQTIIGAVVAFQKDAHESALEPTWDDEFEKHSAAGGTELEWEQKTVFDEGPARIRGETLAEAAISRDRTKLTQAYETISALGMDPVQVMSEAYRTQNGSVTHHNMKIQELERRRREVKRDYDLLQKNRPAGAILIEGSVEDVGFE